MTMNPAPFRPSASASNPKKIEDRRIKEHPLYELVIKNPLTSIYYQHSGSHTVALVRTHIKVIDGPSQKSTAILNIEVQGIAYRNPKDPQDDRIGKRVALWRALDALETFQRVT